MSSNTKSVDIDELIGNVREDPNLKPMEKQFIFSGTKADDDHQVYVEIAGMMRRVLGHSEFILQDIRDIEGNRISPEEYAGETVTGVRGRFPNGLLKERASSRSTSGYAEIISWEENRERPSNSEDVEDLDVDEEQEPDDS